MQLPAAGVAKARRCMYCGGELQLDAEADAAVAEAGRALETVRAMERKFRVNCPLCERVLVFTGEAIGAERRCAYCTALFEVPEAGRPALPGPSASLMEDAPPAAAAELEKAAGLIGLNSLFSASGGWNSLGDEAAMALDALRWRLIRGHAALAPARALAAVLRDVVQTPAPAGVESWICPLPPRWTGDLIARWICSKGECSAQDKDGGTTVVDFVTGSHTAETGKPLMAGSDMKDTLANIAVKAAAAAITDSAFSLDQDDIKMNLDEDRRLYVVKHLLRMTLLPAGAGTSFHFSHRWSTGEELELEPAQTQAVRAVRTELFREMRLFVCFKAVFGDWFNADCLSCLTPAAFGRWLETLHPSLAGHRDIFVAIEDAKVRRAQRRWPEGKEKP